MARAGRKRLTGASRKPSGGIKTSVYALIDRRDDWVALSHRLRKMGIDPQKVSPAEIKMARDPLLGSSFGRLCYYGIITRQQFDAGTRYLDLIDKINRHSIGVAAPVKSLHALMEGRGASCKEEPDEDTIRKWEREWRNIRSYVISHDVAAYGHQGFWNTLNRLPNDPEIDGRDIWALQCALNLLISFWK